MDNKFYHLLGIAIKVSKAKSKDAVEEFKRNSQSVRQIILKLYEENPEATAEEIYEKMQEKLENIVIEISEMDDFKSTNIRRDAIKYFHTTLGAIDQEYQKIIEEEVKKGKKIEVPERIVYSANQSKAIRLLMEAVIADIRLIIEEAHPNNVKILKSASGKERKEIKRTLEQMNGTKEGRETARHTVNFLSNSTELQKVKYYFENLLSQENTDRQLKEAYINSISKIGRILDDFGLLEKYVDQQDRTLTRLKLEEISTLKKDEVFERIFSEEQLGKLNTWQLSALYSFWNNRFIKEIMDIYRAYFIMNKLGLDSKENLDKNNLLDKITPEELEAFNIKISLINMLVTGVYQKYKKQYENGGKIGIEKDIDKLNQEYGTMYERYFSTTGGLRNFKNNFNEDFLDCLGLQNTIENSYLLKDRSIEGLLQLLYNSNISENWGIIEENNKSQYVLVAADINGLNMPLRLHIKRDVIKQFIQENQKNTIIPIYQGADDFTVGGMYISTHLLMPLTSEESKTIEKIDAETRDTEYRSKFIKHITFLANPQKYPEHLQKKVEVKKKGKIKIRSEKIRRYIDLETGEKFSSKPEKQFIPNDDGR